MKQFYINSKIVITFFLIFGFSNAISQQPKTSHFFNTIDIPIEKFKMAENDFATFRLINQDKNSILNFLNEIHKNYTDKGFTSSISIPFIDNSNIDFNIKNSQILTNEFLNQNQTIKSFKGISKNGEYSIRLTLSHLGLMAKIRKTNTNESWYIQPLTPADETLIIYASNDAKLLLLNRSSCLTDEIQEVEKPIINPNNFSVIAAFGDCQVRTYRLAVAATGEYTTWAGSQANATAYIANSINNVGEIYEREATIRFQLITNNSILFTDANSDPYDAGLTSTTITQNNNTLINYIGTANYDLGCVFGYGWSGGLANLNSVCITTTKGRNGSGLNSSFPTGSSGPIFDNTVAHEIGHQFSATHTMSANTSSCVGNVNGSTAYEVGGGSSIMAYAGSCGSLAYQFYSDDFFHAGSLNQITSFASNSTCAVVSASNNNNPTSSVTSNTYNIPHSTPFKLRVNASDLNENSLTYTFDQMNAYGGSGTTNPPSASATFGPLFKTKVPSTDNFRYFPALSNLLGSNDIYEVLPTVARTLNFKATVRDNNDEAGCKASEDFTLNVQNCGAFEFTNLNTATNYVSNGTNTITLLWNTAATCVPTTNVKISFSTDGGITFPYTIVESTLNDGSETILVPNLSTCSGRFMIEAIGNIYFNINKAPITISSSCLANGSSITPNTNIIASAGSTDLNLAESPIYGNSISMPITGTINTASNSGSLSVYNTSSTGCQAFGNPTKFNTIKFVPNTSGDYTFNLSSTTNLSLNLYLNNYVSTNNCNNFRGSTAVYTGSGIVLGSSFTATLCKNVAYELVIQTFSATTPLPANYSINVTSPSGGALYTNTPNPGVGFNYGYVIVNQTTGLISEIKNNANLQNSTIYPSGNFLIYGISTNSSINNLNTTYANTPFSIFNAAVLNQANGLCAQMSNNNRMVTINVPTPIQLLDFKLNKTAQNTALLNWKTIDNNSIAHFEVERSTDGKSFNTIGKVVAQHNNNIALNYSFEDTYFDNVAQPFAFYRLALYDVNNTVSRTAVDYLKNNKTNAFDLSIFPNPLDKALLNIQIQGNTNGNMQLEIIDVMGRVLINENIVKNESIFKKEYDLNHFTAGIYYIKLSFEGKVKTQKLIKK